MYAARPTDVDLVMVNGRILVQDGTAVVCDEAEILAKAEYWRQKISPQGEGI